MGDIVTDVLAVVARPVVVDSDTPADIRVTGGGQAANTAAWLAYLGCPVRLVAAVGDDDAGRARVAELSAGGVECAIQVCPDAATGAIVVLSTGTTRSMISDRGANALLAPQTVVGALNGAAHLHLSAYTLLAESSRRAGLAALAAARDGGLTTSVDAASAQPLREAGPDFLAWCRDVTILLANSDEADVLAGPGTPVDQAGRLARHAGSAVVKRGPGGAVWVGPHGVLELPAPGVPVLDTTGAGDAFAAGLLSAWLTGSPPALALRRAIDAGSYAVRRLGARPPHTVRG